jgi:hypothetical protein
MARPAKKQDTATFEITVPVSLYEALGQLAEYSVFGVTENAVAAYILAKEIERMQRAAEFGLRMPSG